MKRRHAETQSAIADSYAGRVEKIPSVSALFDDRILRNNNRKVARRHLGKDASAILGSLGRSTKKGSG